MDIVSYLCFLEIDFWRSGTLTNARSPYTKTPATIRIGPDNVAYFVPQNFLPADWVRSDSLEPLCFPDVDIQTAHTLVHYLYKGVYEAAVTNDSFTSLHTCTKLKDALLVYVASNDHALPKLQHLAAREIEEHGSRLSLVEILDAIDNDFSKLRQDSWVHDYLRRKAKAAFQTDHTIFTQETFLQNLSNTALIKFIARCIVDLYNTELHHTLATEKALCQRLNTQDQHDQEQPCTYQSNVEDHCGPEKEDSVASENSCTISCPPSEFTDCGVEACANISTATDHCEMSEQAIEKTCYESCDVSMAVPVDSGPEVLDCVPESPPPDVYEPAACEPSWEPWTDEVVSVPTECEAAGCDVLTEPEAGIKSPPQNFSSSRRCHLETRHILEGDGWRTCNRCREAVERLSFQMQSVRVH